jgi:hypothetical protein
MPASLSEYGCFDVSVSLGAKMVNMMLRFSRTRVRPLIYRSYSDMG